MEIEDDSSLEDLEERKAHNPSTPVIGQGFPVYRFREPLLEMSGIPILTDFGQMRPSEPVNQDWWVPDLYRAPEVLLQLPWSFPVDNWTSDPPIPQASLEEFVTTTPPGEEKNMFLKFIRKILTWDPEARATSIEIIHDEWLMRPWEEEF